MLISKKMCSGHVLALNSCAAASLCMQVRYTPLHCAVEGQQPEAVVELLLKGALCNIKDYVSHDLQFACALLIV